MVQVWEESVDWTTTRAWAEGEPGWGYVRINVRGREPQGTVDPADYRALCDEIAGELMKLVNADTDEPAIDEVAAPRGPHRPERRQPAARPVRAVRARTA